MVSFKWVIIIIQYILYSINSICDDNAGTYPHHPRGYWNQTLVPLLRGNNHCPDCLCNPCVIANPPDFLRGSCSPHPANDGKRYRLYRFFWSLLRDLGIWSDKKYLQRKQEHTVRDDHRDIMLKCIIKVIHSAFIFSIIMYILLIAGSEIKVPSHNGQYRDCVHI